MGKFQEVKPSGLSFLKLGKDITETNAFEGLYLGATVNEKFDNMEYKFKREDGSTAIVNGSANLDSRMKAVEIGRTVRIEYLGQKPSGVGKFPNKPAHQVKVLVSEDIQTITPPTETHLRAVDTTAAAAKISKVYKDAKGN